MTACRLGQSLHVPFILRPLAWRVLKTPELVNDFLRICTGKGARPAGIPARKRL